MPYGAAVWSIFLHEKIDEKRARALPLTRGGAFTPIKATPSPIQPLMCFRRRQGDFRKAKIKGLQINRSFKVRLNSSIIARRIFNLPQNLNITL